MSQTAGRNSEDTSLLTDPRLESSLNRNFKEDTEYRVYKRRWFILAVLGILNFSNALSWLTFSPVSDHSANFYNVSPSKIDWLSTVYMIAAIPVGFLAIYLLDTFGLRLGIITGATLNFLGLAVRYLSSFDFISKDHHIPYMIVLGGQTLCAIAQPFLLFAPTKLAATWFAGDQRAVANMIASMLNPLGLLVVNIASPAIVKKDGDITLMLFVYLIPGAIGFLLSIFGFCSSVPPSPPSASAAEVHETFWQGLKKIVRIPAYFLLFVNFGAGFGLLSSILSVLQQILCVRGYTDEFSGYCGASMLGFGIIAAFFSGLYVDKTKKFEEVTKICFSLAVICFMAFTILSTFDDMQIELLIFCTMFGVLGLAQYAITFELGVECTYPVPEATSAGFLAMSGQIQGIAFMLFFQFLATEEIHPNQKCTNNPSEKIHVLTTPLLICCGYVTFTCFLFVTFFKTKYLRLEAEQRSGADSILNYNTIANYRQQPVYS
ncbi:solute carrier family 49 member A3-like [Antedon mediterranea]|uniref:solute carrier family 49 member A3-like n=1 Tax=Antedon mediterranea TaxID=105859 RepID=UPI003AF82483